MSLVRATVSDWLLEFVGTDGASAARVDLRQKSLDRGTETLLVTLRGAQERGEIALAFGSTELVAGFLAK